MNSCPKCKHVRRPDEAAPAWQCPACGVAYAKAAEALRPAVPASPGITLAEPPRSVPWGKLVLIAALLWGAWTGVKLARTPAEGGAIPGLASQVGGHVGTTELAALAARVRPAEVVIYTTSECPYAAQAKGWLQQYGFPFTECNMSVDRHCESEFRSHGADGTPYLIVRGHHMKDGFDSDEFIAALRR